MKKIKLVLRPGEFTSFTSYYLEPLWKEHFDLEWYDSTQTYDRKNTLFVIWHTNADTVWAKQMKDMGFCVAVDNLWETSSNRTDYYWIENIMWFWYNESLWWTKLGLDQYRPSKKIQYTTFMPLRRRNATRDYIVTKLGDYKNNILWSYYNKSLPGDTQDVNQGQRYANPLWYDSTYSSLVVETSQIGQMFITEKTFKPMAFYHPFQIIAMPGILKKLKEQGFETYNNLFDEAYDGIEDFDQRMLIIINNLKEIKSTEYDLLTQEKLTFNRDRFFNVTMVKERIVNEIINPLIEYVQSST